MDGLLITGAGGFIGRACLAHVARRGLPIIATTHAPTAPPDAEGLRWRRCDLLDRAAIEALLDETRPRGLLHLAWVTTDGYRTSPDNARWLAAGRHLLDAFAARGGRRAVVAGTCAEYDWRAGTMDERRTPLRPRSPYARAKRALSEHLGALGLDGAWARIFFAYGPGEPPTKLVSSVVRSLRAGRPARCGDGARRRDFIHVDDVGAGLVALLESEVCGPVNVGTGRTASIGEVARELGRLVGAPELVEVGGRADEPEPPLVVADIGRLHEEVGFAPMIDLGRGLRDCVRRLMETEVAS